MLKIIPAALFFLSFFASLVSNAILRQISKKNNFLIDKPDKERKFHSNPTPLTGGIGISIGIIFSSIFLFFLTQNNLDIAYSPDNYLNVNETLLNDEDGIVHEVNLSDEKSIKIKVIDSETFLMVLPDGKKQIYQIPQSENFKKVLKREVSPNTISVTKFSIGLIFFTILVQLIMLLDDFWGIKEKHKLLIQAICVTLLIFFSDVYITNLGNLFGFGEIYLGFFGIPFTVFCVVGMMNAYNYIDGLNGLCASFCLVCLISIIFIVNATKVLGLLPLVLPVGAIVGFLVYNLGILGEKRNVFLGDNGSQALGFLCLWVLVYFSQLEGYNFAPITAVWLVSILFIDAVRVLLTRFLAGHRGNDLFRARRDHVHHVLQDYGFSKFATYSILVSFTIFLSILGTSFNYIFQDMPYYSFYIFVVLWIFIHILINKMAINV